MNHRVKAIILIVLMFILVPLIAIGEFKDGSYDVANSADHLGFFAATTSAQLAGVLSDETGTGGGFVRATAPTLEGLTVSTTAIQCTGAGAPSSGVGLELAYASGTAYITSYDRTAGVYEDVRIRGDYVDIYALKAGSIYQTARFGGGNARIYGDLYVDGLLDPTPFYQGDALSEINKIKADKDGELDHATLPAFARKRAVMGERKEKVSVPVKQDDAFEKGNLKPDVQLDWKTGTFFKEEEITIEEELHPDGRNIGAMVSLLTRAVQQLSERLEAIEKKK